MNPFDILRAPLDGVNLIEASAGTGKTYAIEGLYVRLLLEKQLSLDQILVVTFTRAATDELKSRIRKKLMMVQAAFDSSSCDDAFVHDLCACAKDPHQARGLIRNALINFDKAAIYTIHGFCQRILAEASFETQYLFDFEVITDPSEILNEIADDYWRIQFYRAPLEVVSHAIKHLHGPEYFYRLAAKAVRPDLLIFPRAERLCLESRESYRGLLQELKTAWEKSGNEVLSLLKDPSLNGNVYGSTQVDQDSPGLSKRDIVVAKLGNAMDKFIAATQWRFPPFEKFELFTQNKIVNATKKNCRTPRHPFFILCGSFFDISLQLKYEMDAFLLFFKSQFFKYAGKAFSEKKKKSNRIGYDDLLVMVRQALDRNQPAYLTEKIRQTYKAALVDEFQDTDAIQYEIFSRLFRCENHTLFMIGDPKQAIYGFRGADIFTYIEAAANADNPYTLLKNFRSTPSLIDAVNCIFSNRDRPFLLENLVFGKSQPGTPEKPGEKSSLAGLVLWHLFQDPNKSDPLRKDQPISKAYAMERISEAMAGEILKLVSQRNDPVCFGDIAILVRTNRQAKIIKNRLSIRNIPCVVYQTGNIFETREALELKRVLRGIVEFGDERRIAAALSTDLMGVNGSKFDSEHSSSTYENKIASFRNYSVFWRTEGFMRLLRRLMSEENVKERLMRFQDGERRLTNLLHLSEILHQTENEKSLAMSDLLKWLEKKTASSSPGSEEHLLRLENDARAVNILTIHKSKGLEFPIVFCPFPWDESSIREKEIEYHEPSLNNRLIFDIGSEKFEENRKIAENEKLAENLRLFYVSLTRAKKRCYLVWGRIRGGETSAPAYLFHCAGLEENPLSDESAKIFLSKENFELMEDLLRVSDRSNGAISLAALPELSVEKPGFKAQTRENLFPRIFSSVISNTFRIASYSSLIAGKTHANDLLDRPGDIVTPLREKQQAGIGRPTPRNGQNALDISEFPGGTRSGLFFHTVLEKIEFDSFTQDSHQDSVAKELIAYGFNPVWTPAVLNMISNVVSTPLPAAGNGIKLRSVSMKKRLNEMEFYYPIKKISPEKLAGIFAPFGLCKPFCDYVKDLGKLTFSPFEGFIKGFIDMVFLHENRYFIVDWKSNCLGPGHADYHRDKILETMIEHHYILQSLLYALALHRYLGVRLPSYRYEKDFGGVFYLFIRGMDPAYEDSAGIYFDRPNLEIMETLTENLMEKTENHNSKHARN